MIMEKYYKMLKKNDFIKKKMYRKHIKGHYLDCERSERVRDLSSTKTSQ